MAVDDNGQLDPVWDDMDRWVDRCMAVPELTLLVPIGPWDSSLWQVHFSKTG